MSTPSIPRTGIIAADPDASVFAPTIVAPAQSLRIGATCDTPGATIEVSVYFLDASLQPMTVARVQFTSQATPDWAGKVYVATPSYDPCWPMGGAKAAVVTVDKYSIGTWSLDGTMA